MPLVAMDIQLHQVDLEDEQRRFGIGQLNPDLHWMTRGKAAPSALSLVVGHLFKIGSGQVQANMLVANGQLQVKDEIIVPSLGGDLNLHNLLQNGLPKSSID